MADTVIYPLSEDTGLRILAQLTRIADALEGTGTSSGAEVVNDVLMPNDATIENDYLVTNGAISDGYLEI